MAGQQPWADDFTDNDPALHTAVAGSYPSYTAMLAELRRLAIELTAFITAFPPDYVAQKNKYFNVAYGLLNSHLHTNGHTKQIEKALQIARQ